MSIYGLKIMYNTNTRKYLRQATESWKQECIRKANYTCYVSGKKKGKSNLILTVHHSETSFESIVKQAHDALGIKYRRTTTEYQPGELKAVMEEVERIHREEHIEGIVLTKEIHDSFHAQYGKNAPMADLRAMKKNYRKTQVKNRNRCYKQKRSA